MFCSEQTCWFKLEGIPRYGHPDAPPEPSSFRHEIPRQHMVEEMPDFETAAIKLRRFLQGQERPSEIRWVFREDVVELERKVFVRLPLPDSRT